MNVRYTWIVNCDNRRESYVETVEAQEAHVRADDGRLEFIDRDGSRAITVASYNSAYWCSFQRRESA